MINFAWFRRTTFWFDFVRISDTGSRMWLPIRLPLDYVRRVSSLDLTGSC